MKKRNRLNDRNKIVTRYKKYMSLVGAVSIAATVIFAATLIFAHGVENSTLMILTGELFNRLKIFLFGV